MRVLKNSAAGNPNASQATVNNFLKFIPLSQLIMAQSPGSGGFIKEIGAF